jgi:hypothetical protein
MKIADDEDEDHAWLVTEVDEALTRLRLGQSGPSEIPSWPTASKSVARR